MLWRALRQVERGFYVDVGACDPDLGSVTKAFYERGWRGVNVEPQPGYHRRLVAARPRDRNLRVALGEHAGDVTMHVIADTGLSTLDAVEAAKRAGEGFRVVDEVVIQETLATICARDVPPEQPVHFLKVDVEGSERAVLLGADWGSCRPWIVVVEATRPMTQEPTYEEWEAILVRAGYGFVYGDGLNRFYVASERDDLRESFAYPPNIFDEFVRVSEMNALTRARRSEADRAAILTSRTWRYTRPLRATARRARRLSASLRRLPDEASRRIRARSAPSSRIVPIRRDERQRHLEADIPREPTMPRLDHRSDGRSKPASPGPSPRAKGSTPTVIADLSPRAQRIHHDLSSPDGTG